MMGNTWNDGEYGNTWNDGNAWNDGEWEDVFMDNDDYYLIFYYLCQLIRF